MDSFLFPPVQSGILIPPSDLVAGILKRTGKQLVKQLAIAGGLITVIYFVAKRAREPGQSEAQRRERGLALLLQAPRACSIYRQMQQKHEKNDSKPSTPTSASSTTATTPTSLSISIPPHSPRALVADSGRAPSPISGDLPPLPASPVEAVDGARRVKALLNSVSKFGRAMYLLKVDAAQTIQRSFQAFLERKLRRHEKAAIKVQQMGRAFLRRRCERLMVKSLVSDLVERALDQAASVDATLRDVDPSNRREVYALLEAHALPKEVGSQWETVTPEGRALPLKSVYALSSFEMHDGTHFHRVLGNRFPDFPLEPTVPGTTVSAVQFKAAAESMYGPLREIVMFEPRVLPDSAHYMVRFHEVPSDEEVAECSERNARARAHWLGRRDFDVRPAQPPVFTPPRRVIDLDVPAQHTAGCCRAEHAIVNTDRVVMNTLFITVDGQGHLMAFPYTSMPATEGGHPPASGSPAVVEAEEA